MAAHGAFSNDTFCTGDQGRSAGGKSIFDGENRRWLSHTYDVRFAAVAGLQTRYVQARHSTAKRHPLNPFLA